MTRTQPWKSALDVLMFRGARLCQHSRQSSVVLPGASWINLVERWFGELTARKLRRGTRRSVKELNADIEDWVEHWNENPPASG